MTKSSGPRRLHGIVEELVDRKRADWSDSSIQTALIDCQCVLEALVTEPGEYGAVRALERQGLKADAFRYVVIESAR